MTIFLTEVYHFGMDKKRGLASERDKTEESLRLKVAGNNL
jgi:hypothetical protein